MGEEIIDATSLIQAVGNLRYNHSPIQIEDLLKALNAFVPASECADVIFTQNVDKMAFGVMVTPSLTSDMINSILISGESIKLSRYFVEIDSKVFDYGLSDDEIAAMMLYNIYHLTATSDPVDRLRSAIDLYFVKSNTQLHIRDSIQYQQILELGLVDTLIKFTNCLFLDSSVLNDPYMAGVGMDESFISGVKKLFNNIPGYDNTASKYPMLVILDWCFRLYDNVEEERIPALHQLKRSKALTASVLYNRIIDKAIDSLYKIDTDSLVESTIIGLQEKGGSLFSQIKYNGMRAIEQDFYEFMVVARNATTEDETLYALKQINTRLAIIEDYIRNEDLSDADKQRWTDLYERYCTIRDEIAKKKVYNKKNYGIFVDYNQLGDYDGEGEGYEDEE